MCFKLLFKKRKVKYLITYISGFAESNHPLHRWKCGKVVEADPKKDINHIVADLTKEETKGAHKYFKLENISIIK